LAYVVNPNILFPLNALTATIPKVIGSQVVLTGWSNGTYKVTWSTPSTGKSVSSATVKTTDGKLAIAVPTYLEDLFLRVVRK